MENPPTDKAELADVVRNEIQSWKVSFDPDAPSILRSIHAGGRFAAWNQEQSDVDSVLRPDDEIARVGICVKHRDGKFVAKEDMRGRNLFQALTMILERALEAPLHDTGKWLVVLTFRAPRALPRLRVEEEIKEIQEAGCNVTTKAATCNALRTLISTAQCYALHLSLHCAVGADHLVFFEDQTGRAHVVQGDQLRQLLSEGQRTQSIRLVFLNCCHSATLGQYFVDVGVRHVVCVHNESEVLDTSCALFARHFWAALQTKQKTVKEAFDCGVAALKFSPRSDVHKDAESFMLLPKDGNHNIFPELPTKAWQPPSSLFGSFGQSPPAIQDFVGREIDMHRLLDKAVRRRFVEVIGEPGIGKTSLVVEACRFLLLRREFFQDVMYIDDMTEEPSPQVVDKLLLSQQEVQGHRVLVIYDRNEPIAADVFSRLMSFGGINMVLVKNEFTAPVVRLALDKGLNPGGFNLGPLGPFSQVELFLKRCRRPISTDQLQMDVEGRGKPVRLPLRPAQSLQLADSPVIRAQRGNPKLISNAAFDLGLPPQQGVAGAKGCASGEEDNIARSCSTERQQDKEQPVSVRLVSQDGKVKNVWLLPSQTIEQVREKHCPKGLRGSCYVDIIVCGSAVDPKMTVGQFAGMLPSRESLQMEFRQGDEDEW